MRTLNLISLYYYVCQLYDTQLHAHCFRHTKNNVDPIFTDQEAITIFLFVLREYRPRSIKELHKIAEDAYRDWFPFVPGYETFLRRLNRMSSVFGLIANDLAARMLCQRMQRDELCDEEWLLTDSFPVITCAGNRQGIIAPEITARGYNSTKRMHFWGVKVHVIAYKSRGRLPVPVKLWVGPASEHDYQAQVCELEQLASLNISGDKAFESKELKLAFKNNEGDWMIGKKDNYRKNREKRQRHIAADNMYNKVVSKLKQSIEALFANFAYRGIQTASVVRSTAGLTRHVMAHAAVALLEPVLLS